MEPFDLVIVGGGPVAGILAALLAKTPWRTALIDESKSAVGSRAIALNESSQRIFQYLGVWDLLVKNAGKIREIEVSRRGEFGKTHLSALDIQASALGWVVPETDLIIAIDQQLTGLPNLTRIAATPQSITRQDDATGIGLNNGTRVDARLVIGADGTNSNLRQLAGLQSHRHDFNSVAICATVSCNQPHQNQAWERFTDSGPIALLPLADPHTCSLVWCLDKGDADEYLRCDLHDFIARLQQQFGDSAGLFTSAQNRTGYSLEQSLCDQPVAERLLLVGSAARHLHPVGGQGLNLAIRDLAVLADLLELAGRQNADPGNRLLLSQFCDLRRTDWQATAKFSRHLPGVFSSHLPPLAVGRNLALTALELLPPLRRAFVRRATGQLSYREPHCEHKQ